MILSKNHELGRLNVIDIMTLQLEKQTNFKHHLVHQYKHMQLKYKKHITMMKKKHEECYLRGFQNNSAEVKKL